MMLATTTSDAKVCVLDSGLPRFDAPLPDGEPPLDESDDVDVGSGCAIGDVGLYVTPLTPAATSKTEPPPYS